MAGVSTALRQDGGVVSRSAHPLYNRVSGARQVVRCRACKMEIAKVAGSLNQVQIIGNLGRDPEIRSTNSGMRIANLAVATTDSWNDRQTGERKEKTEWHRVTVTAERLIPVIEKYVKKGSRIYVQGSLQTRKWTDQQGQEKYSTEILLSQFRGELLLMDGANSNGNAQAQPQRQATPAPQRQAPQPPLREELNDDIPF